MLASVRAVALVLLMVSIGVSGCAGSAEPKDASDGASQDPMGAGNETSGHIMADIVVKLDGNTTEPQNGSIGAPAGANITFDGTGSMGSNLTYAWDFGDNATGTNATEVHAYAVPGLFNVTLVVSEGNATSNSTVLLNVTASGPPPGTVLGVEKKEFTGSLTAGNPNSATNAGVDYNDHVVEIKAAAPDGTAGAAKKVVLTLDGSGAANLDMSLVWRSPAGTQLAAAGTQLTPDEKLTYEGDMPPGNYVARVRLFAGAQATYKVTAEVTYVAA